MKKIVIGLVGRMGSGKSTVGNMILEGREGDVIKFSDILHWTLVLYGIEHSTKNLQILSTILRQNFGEDLLTNVIAGRIYDITAEFIIVDGVCRSVDVAMLKSLEDEGIGVALFFVHRSRQKRFDAIQQGRNEKTDNQVTWEEFQKKDDQECELQIDMLGYTDDIYICDIDNNGSLEQLKKEVETKVKEVISKM